MKKEQGGHTRELTQLEKQLQKLEFKLQDPLNTNSITPNGEESDRSTDQD